MKTRNLQQCLSERINQFWKNSVPLKEGMVGPNFCIPHLTFT